jgi:hypothetical protein
MVNRRYGYETNARGVQLPPLDGAQWGRANQRINGGLPGIRSTALSLPGFRSNASQQRVLASHYAGSRGMYAGPGNIPGNVGRKPGCSQNSMKA